MRQQVNLLSEELKPRRELLSLTHLLGLWASVVVVLVLVSSWQGFSAWRLSAQRQAQETVYQRLVESNQALKQRANRPGDPELVTELESLREQLTLHTLLVDAVAGYEQSSREGFSGYLADLARQHVEGLSLSRIEFRHGGSTILLSGETLTPVNVPLFLKQLSRGERFRGHRFDALELEAQDNGLLRFDIRGPVKEDKG